MDRQAPRRYRATSYPTPEDVAALSPADLEYIKNLSRTMIINASIPGIYDLDHDHFEDDDEEVTLEGEKGEHAAFVRAASLERSDSSASSSSDEEALCAILLGHSPKIGPLPSQLLQAEEKAVVREKRESQPARTYALTLAQQRCLVAQGQAQLASLRRTIAQVTREKDQILFDRHLANGGPKAEPDLESEYEYFTKLGWCAQRKSGAERAAEGWEEVVRRDQMELWRREEEEAMKEAESGEGPRGRQGA